MDKSGEYSGLGKKRGSTIKMGEKQKDTTHKRVICEAKDTVWGKY